MIEDSLFIESLTFSSGELGLREYNSCDDHVRAVTGFFSRRYKLEKAE